MSAKSSSQQRGGNWETIGNDCICLERDVLAFPGYRDITVFVNPSHTKLRVVYTFGYEGESKRIERIRTVNQFRLWQLLAEKGTIGYHEFVRNVENLKGLEEKAP